MATIRDVAKHAGVAPITVSRVINNSGHVSQEVRERVERSIAELDYIPNALGPSLRSKRTQILALVLSDVTNPFWTTVARGVEDACNERGYYVVLCNTDESQSKQDQYVTVMLRKQVDGFLLVPATSTTKVIQTIHRQGIPVVVLDRRVPGHDVDIVRCDSEEGAYILTRHLLQQGHRHIAMLSGPQTVSTARDRVAGYQRAILEAGLPVDEQTIFWDTFDQNAGYEVTKEALRNNPRPTALFAGNNFIAIGAMHALREASIRVPQDMAMVSFDDFPAGLTIEPFFTSAIQPAYQMGYRGTELLLSRVLGQTAEPYQEIVLPIEVIVRQSSQGTL